MLEPLGPYVVGTWEVRVHVSQGLAGRLTVVQSPGASGASACISPETVLLGGLGFRVLGFWVLGFRVLEV